MSNIPILQLYSKEESYLWANRKEILESCDVIYNKTMYNSCPLLDKFIEFGRKKEKIKESNNILRLLNDRSNDNIDTDSNNNYTPDKTPE
jgi:hypothetical protein